MAGKKRDWSGTERGRKDISITVELPDRDSHVVNITQVKPQPPIRAPAPQGPLPFTGFAARTIVFLALALLVSGSGAVWVTRRKERRGGF